ncbi:AAA family ATPase [Endozoicomonas sp.]|uniref:AAA family ATPase n=1 Tax=Endozoicomonas sp. TaxID=1892382 RepID=UPI003AF6EE14
MKKVVIFGNSGSGKSTLAKVLCQSEGLKHLDLDCLAWQAVSPPERKPISESRRDIEAFISQNSNWVIEGCYSDLLELAIPFSSEIIFLDLPVDVCITNARNRPWEPHKYESKEAQDVNLNMLIDWITQYPQRSDTFSRSSHQTLFDGYRGMKKIYTENIRQEE